MREEMFAIGDDYWIEADGGQPAFEKIADAQAPFWRHVREAWPSSIRNSPPPFHKRSRLWIPPEQPSAAKREPPALAC